jgi:peptidoglycan/xylan/chitin deacetylase (PgdA/CDA1 family)
MKESGFKMTLYAIAKAMERNPDFARACVREGHEIAAHGLRWLEFWDYDIQQDKKYIKDTFSELERVTGERPVGFYFGRGTPQTHVLVPEVCREQGWELKYSSEVCTCFKLTIIFEYFNGFFPSVMHLADFFRHTMTMYHIGQLPL